MMHVLCTKGKVLLDWSCQCHRLAYLHLTVGMHKGGRMPLLGRDLHCTCVQARLSFLTAEKQRCTVLGFVWPVYMTVPIQTIALWVSTCQNCAGFPLAHQHVATWFPWLGLQILPHCCHHSFQCIFGTAFIFGTAHC